MDKEIKQYHDSFLPVITNAESIAVTDPASMKEATQLLSVLNRNLDQVKAEKEKVLKPLREAAKAEQGRWKPLEDLLKPLVTRLRLQIGKYQTAELRRKREAEQAVIDQMKKDPEAAIKALGDVAGPDEVVETEDGAVSFRKKKIVKITDEKKIPKQYWIVDVDAVFADLKAGKAVPGAEIDIEMVPVNTR